MSDKEEWLIWDVAEELWWRRIGDDHFDHTDSIADAARLTLDEAREWVDAVNDPANDPVAALVPANTTASDEGGKGIL